MTYQEKQIEQAKLSFKDHIVNYKRLDGLETVDWRNKDGSSNYYVRYVFDESRCCLYISGDLGSAVVQLTEKATLKTLSNYINMISYFVGKIECSTDKYEYPYEAVAADVMAEFEEWSADCIEPDEADKEKYQELKELFTELPSYCGLCDGWDIPDDVIEKLSEYVDEWYEHILHLGRRVDNRVILWLVGMNMAYKQLN